MTFIKRDSKTNPTDMTYSGSITETNKYWYDNDFNAGAKASICLPNCTTYAMGRSGEIAKRSVRNYEIMDRTGFPNAAQWFENAKWETGQTPKLGAIACWTDNGKGWGGHVAIVEETNGTNAGTMLSMSGYQDASSGDRSFENPGSSASWFFQYLDWTTSNYYYTTYKDRGGTFLGYIYNPYVTQSETTDKLSSEVITSGDIKYIKWGNYSSINPDELKVTVAAYRYDGEQSGAKFNLFESQPNSNPGNDWTLAAVINGGIFYSYEGKFYNTGFEKAYNNLTQEQFGSNDNYLSFGSKGQSIEIKTAAEIYNSISSYISGISGDAIADGSEGESGTLASTIHTFVATDGTTNMIGWNYNSLTGAAVISAVQSILPGAKVAIYDGGGSTQCLLNGERVRESSDSGGVRLVKNAICIYKKAQYTLPTGVARDTSRDQVHIKPDTVLRFRTEPNTNTTNNVIGLLTPDTYSYVINKYEGQDYTWFQLSDTVDANGTAVGWAANVSDAIEFLPAEETKVALTIGVYPEGTVEVTGAGEYNIGDQVIVTAKCSFPKEFAGWYTTDDVLLSKELSYTFTINEATTIVAKSQNAVYGECILFRE